MAAIPKKQNTIAGNGMAAIPKIQSVTINIYCDNPLQVLKKYLAIFRNLKLDFLSGAIFFHFYVVKGGLFR